MIKIIQLLADLYDCKADLNDVDLLENVLEEAASEVNAKIVRRITHRFSPVGVTVMLILAETHLSIHSWPEYGYAAADIFICGEGKDPLKALIELSEYIEPWAMEINEVTRTVGKARK